MTVANSLVRHSQLGKLPKTSRGGGAQIIFGRGEVHFDQNLGGGQHCITYLALAAHFFSDFTIVVIFVFLKNIYHFWSKENFVFFQKQVFRHLINYVAVCKLYITTKLSIIVYLYKSFFVFSIHVKCKQHPETHMHF